MGGDGTRTDQECFDCEQPLYYFSRTYVVATLFGKVLLCHPCSLQHKEARTWQRSDVTVTRKDIARWSNARRS